MKGLELSMTMIIALVLGVIVLAVTIGILSGNIDGLTAFASENVDFGVDT